MSREFKGFFIHPWAFFSIFSSKFINFSTQFCLNSFKFSPIFLRQISHFIAELFQFHYPNFNLNFQRKVSVNWKVAKFSRAFSLKSPSILLLRKVSFDRQKACFSNVYSTHSKSQKYFQNIVCFFRFFHANLLPEIKFVLWLAGVLSFVQQLIDRKSVV